jgi:hypothetical protein
MGAGARADVDPKNCCVFYLVCVWLRVLLVDGLGVRLDVLDLWLLCSWLRVVRCMACMMGRDCLVCRFHLCRARLGGLLRWLGVSCTSGTGVYLPGVRGVL